jgi:flagellar hook-associated protein 2
MSGAFSAGGLITGIDTNSLVTQLMQLERRPIFRMQRRITSLEKQQAAVKDLRTQLQTLRSKMQDFRFGIDFDSFNVDSSEESIATAIASGPNPASGSFSVNVTRLASATNVISSGRLGAPINPAAQFANSGINHDATSGIFSINGTPFDFDLTVSSLNDIMGVINGAGIGVTATYDGVTDKVTIVNSTPGDTTIINFGASDDTSNFLDLIGMNNATQVTNGSGSTEVESIVGLENVNQGRLLNTLAFDVAAVGAGSFFINGVSISVDPTVDALSDVIERINNSDAGVQASYDPTSDGVRIVSKNLGSCTLSFMNGTSNFLDVMKLTAAVQTAGKDSEFSIDGGPVQTHNSNDITAAIADIKINLKSLGTTTVTVGRNQDAAIELIQEFVDVFNESIKGVANLVADEGGLSNDATIRTIKSALQSIVFDQISGLSGSFESILNIEISTGDDFDPSAVFALKIDETELREAIDSNFVNVEELFANDAETGIADQLFDYLDEITKTGGFLHLRAKPNGSIDAQIQNLNDNIEAMEKRIVVRERRLRASFTRMEQMAANFQAQATAFTSFSAGVGRF